MPTLRLVSAPPGRVIEIHDRAVIGRQPGVDVLIEDSSVSRQHAIIEHGPRGWTLTDRGSANGTWIGDQRVTAAYLHDGQTLRFGLAGFRVELPAEAAATTVMPAVAGPPARASAPMPPVDERLPPTLAAGRGAAPRARSPVSVTGVLDFNALPVRTRQRLVECLGGRGEPRPLAVARTPGSWGPLLAVPVLGALLLGVLAFDFGVPGRSWLGWGALILVAPLVLAAAWSLLSGVHRLVRARLLPFPAGRFLFPLDVVEAGWSVGRWPIAGAEKIDAVHHMSQGRYTHTALSFKFPGRRALRFELRPRAHADAVLSALQAARDAAVAAQGAGDARALARLDPLGEP